MHKGRKVVITTPFPKVEEVAKVLGVSRLRTEYLEGLMDGIQAPSKGKKKTRS